MHSVFSNDSNNIGAVSFTDSVFRSADEWKDRPSSSSTVSSTADVYMPSMSVSAGISTVSPDVSTHSPTLIPSKSSILSYTVAPSAVPSATPSPSTIPPTLSPPVSPSPSPPVSPSPSPPVSPSPSIHQPRITYTGLDHPRDHINKGLLQKRLNVLIPMERETIANVSKRNTYRQQFYEHCFDSFAPLSKKEQEMPLKKYMNNVYLGVKRNKQGDCEGCSRKTPVQFSNSTRPIRKFVGNHEVFNITTNENGNG